MKRELSISGNNLSNSASSGPIFSFGRLIGKQKGESVGKSGFFCNTRQLITENIFFFCPYSLFIMAGIVVVSFYSKIDIHVAINSFHSPFFDVFFKSVTFLGNGIMYLFVFVCLLIRKSKLTVAFVVAVVASNVVLYVFKHFLFSDMYRPSKYFDMYENYKLYLVRGVKLHSLNSFPSGHTTTAFTVFFTLAAESKKNVLKLFFCAVALLAGYSRVYLSQHFLIDVVAGAVLGVSVVVLAAYWSGYVTGLFFGGRLKRGNHKK